MVGKNETKVVGQESVRLKIRVELFIISVNTVGTTGRMKYLLIIIRYGKPVLDFREIKGNNK